MSYNLRDHGDLLEKEAIEFIEKRFQNYGLVWQIFIGNDGNSKIAKLPNYDQYKRQNFAENSYTILESFYILNNILESKIFTDNINTLEKYIDFIKSYVTFFAYIGRIHDVSKKASNILKYDNSSFLSKIHKFYETRNVIIHGKKIPLLIDDLGLIKTPEIFNSYSKGITWNDNSKNWDEISSMVTYYVEDNVAFIFNELLEIVNNEYAVFKDLIHVELKKNKTALIFEFDTKNNIRDKHDFITSVSGSYVSEIFDNKSEKNQ